MQFRLFLGALAKRAGTKIDLLTVLVDPNERMAIFADLKIFEVLGVLQIGENLATRNHGPQVDHPDVAIVPFDLQDAVDHGLRGNDVGDITHHKSSTRRAGSSRHSFTRTRKVTA